jgi:hypothetical protein
MTRREDGALGALASLRLLITFIVAGLASASSVGLVAIIDTWWILVLVMLFVLATTGAVVAVIVSELDRTNDHSRGSGSHGDPCRNVRAHAPPRMREIVSEIFRRSHLSVPPLSARRFGRRNRLGYLHYAARIHRR